MFVVSGIKDIVVCTFCNSLGIVYVFSDTWQNSLVCLDVYKQRNKPAYFERSSVGVSRTGGLIDLLVKHLCSI